MNDRTHAGGCLCGGVRYVARGPLRHVIACHCSQCRRSSGHHVAASQVPTENLQLLSQETLTWYASSDEAQRGFCNRCGSNLFWRQRIGGDGTSIMAGTLDTPTHLRLVQHIFTADKSDYYDIADGVAQSARWPEGEK